MRGQLPRRNLVWVHADCSAVRAAGGPGAQGSGTPGHALHGSRNRLRSRRWCSAVPGFGSLSAVPGPLPGGCLPRSGIERGYQESVAVVFQAFNQYAGVGVGENLGYLFTGLWTLLVAQAMFGSALPLRRWLGLLGVVSAVGIVLGMPEPAGFEPAANIVVGHPVVDSPLHSASFYCVVEGPLSEIVRLDLATHMKRAEAKPLPAFG